MALLLVVTGCSPKQQPLPSKQDLPGVIQKIIADQLGKPVEEISPTATFAKLGADDLDLVEITMAVEERLGITISDEELAKAAKVSSDQNLAPSLTVSAFVAAVTAAIGTLEPTPRKDAPALKR